MMNSCLLSFLSCSLLLVVASATSSSSSSSDGWYRNELIEIPGTIENDYQSPLPHTYIDTDDLPDSFSWDNIDGQSFLTKSLNQHIPQYCGSCWAHAALSSLADRIKIARGAMGDDVNLSIQYILNCGTHRAGSCHGGSSLRTYRMIKEDGFVPYDTCQPYIACSVDSEEGFCPNVDTTCNALNTCRTCTSFLGSMNLHCNEIDIFPNATVAEYGTYKNDTDAVRAEIYARGPVVASLAGGPLGNYTGGIFNDTNASRHRSHAVSIVGWGKNEDTDTMHWIVRNSWGQYWGEMGYFRVEMGKNLIGIEESISWATPGKFTVMNFPCHEDGKNCGPETQTYFDPSLDVAQIQRRLARHKV